MLVMLQHFEELNDPYVDRMNSANLGMIQTIGT